MGKRKGMPLTEIEYLQIKEALIKEDRMELFAFYEIFIKTGIRTSDWEHLVAYYNKYKCQMFEMMIQKQSKLKPGQKPIYVKRLIKIPASVYKMMEEGKYSLVARSNSGIKQKANQILKVAVKNGINRPLSPHDFRHTFVVFAKHRGWDIIDVLDATKHASLDSILEYFHEDKDVIEGIYDSLDRDFFSLNNPKVAQKRINKLERENRFLQEKLKYYEEKEKTCLKK